MSPVVARWLILHAKLTVACAMTECHCFSSNQGKVVQREESVRGLRHQSGAGLFLGYLDPQREIYFKRNEEA